MTRRVRMVLCVPVVLDLDVAWDGDAAEVQEARIAPNAAAFGPDVYEYMNEGDFRELDMLTRAAFEEAG